MNYKLRVYRGREGAPIKELPWVYTNHATALQDTLYKIVFHLEKLNQNKLGQEDRGIKLLCVMCMVISTSLGISDIPRFLITE